MTPAEGEAVLSLRDEQTTVVILDTGAVVEVNDIVWGRDTGDDVDHVTANISPPIPDRPIHFFFTNQVVRVIDPVTGDVLFFSRSH